MEAELLELLDATSHRRLADGRAEVVSNGYLPDRRIQTGIGAVTAGARSLWPMKSGYTLENGKAGDKLRDIWQAETKKSAIKAFDHFIKVYKDKYPKATLCLQKDWAELLAFYDFPAEHWQSIRTSNPIESAFATIRHRTKKSKGCLSRSGMLQMMFKLGSMRREEMETFTWV